MSSITSKAKLLGTIITLITAGTISVSAQTPAVVGAAKVRPVTTRDGWETDYEKQSGPGADETAQPGEVSEVKRSSEVSDSIVAYVGTNVTAGLADKGLAATTNGANATPQSTSTDSWQFQLTPYLWIPTISGRAGIGNLITDTNTSVSNADVGLNFGFMGAFEARKNKLIILTDLQYSDIATEKGNPGPLYLSSRASFKTFVLDPEVGYRLLDNEKGAFVDVLGGLRYWHLNAVLAFRARILPDVEVSRSRSWIDGVAGLRGKAALSRRWFVSGKADLGAGGSKFTYQLFGGVGFNVGKRLALIGGYRDLNVNYDKDGFLFDMSLHGPIFGFGFKF